ncbi:MAG: long-chain-acyl-CoA synthetase [Pseudomonadota bacterium]
MKLNYLKSNDDIITPLRLLKQVPSIARKAPRMVQGLRIARNNDPDRIAGLGWAVEEAARHNPRGNAVLYQDARISYAEFNGWANRIAHHFHAQGLRKGDVVCVFIENRPELMATVAGLAKLGVVAALVNTSQTAHVLIHSINLVKPKGAIIGDELLPAFDAVRNELALPEAAQFRYPDAETRVEAALAARYRNLATEIERQPSTNPASTAGVKAGDGLFYIYTSGTTGLPKAAIFSQGRFMKAYGGFGYSLQLGKDDVIYVTLPLYHATAMVVCWGSALAGYAGVGIRRRFSASEFWNDVRRFDASAFGYVGELCRYLMDKPPTPQDRQHRVRAMIGNGMRPNIWKAFKQRFGVDTVMELYGSSEGNIGFSNIFNFDNTVGFSPLPFAIVGYDRESEEPIRDQRGFMTRVKRGEIGLLIGEITDKTPFDGYTDPAKNEACLLRDVFVKGDRYFNTGDLVRDIGFRHAQFVDRTGDTFRWKGENVSTTEVENILGHHDSVEHGVVYGVEIPNTNGRAGMAALTPRGEFGPEQSAALLAFLKRELPPYAIPVFLRLQAAAQTTGTFKYQKAHLKKEGFDPAAVAGDRLMVWLPGTTEYTWLTAEVHAALQGGDYRF